MSDKDSNSTTPTVPTGLKYYYSGLDVASLKGDIARHLTYEVGRDAHSATPRNWLTTAIRTVRDRLIERWLETMRTYHREDAKRVYYLSMEFLIGRSLGNSLINLDAHQECERALAEMGLDLHSLEELETDAALGNGGLGRLAACLLDSLATLRYPAVGYGIRYEYGMFKQTIEDGQQVEHPDNWLRYGNAWEFPRPEMLYHVHFHGHVETHEDETGWRHHRWVDTDEVMAMAYDVPVPGFRTNTVNNLRLWSAKATRDFELGYFNEGDYVRAVEEKNRTENLSRILYPDDTTDMGKELRLKQEYFYISATVQDILRRFLQYHDDLSALPQKVAIQLNDTHPALAIVELMRLLVDSHQVEWETAWSLVRGVFGYTNHTLMPEALEAWPEALLSRVLPRHMEIIYEINRRLMEQVSRRQPDNPELARNVSLIEEGGTRRVRLAHLAFIGSHRVNGVSKLHTELMRQTTFSELHTLFPQRIINITNGITPRRWLYLANPALSDLVSEHLGQGWPSQLDKLAELAELADKPGFQQAFDEAKRANKARLAGLIQSRLGIGVDPDSLFDVQIKRIHEYKRQLLNLLHVVALYNRIRKGSGTTGPPRTVIFSGKTAPGYQQAKLIIRLINDVAERINNDPQVEGRLKVVFIPNYDVTTATDIIPAADLSEQISLAGTEASGTGNMKLALNGALTIATHDGANVEIHDAVGADNIFMFGMTPQEVAQRRQAGYDPYAYYSEEYPELEEALDQIAGGFFSPGERDRYAPIVESLTSGGDRFMILADFPDYLRGQERVAAAYADRPEWIRKAVLNVAAMGHFSSDRTAREYAERVWEAQPVFHD